MRAKSESEKPRRTDAGAAVDTRRVMHRELIRLTFSHGAQTRPGLVRNNTRITELWKPQIVSGRS